MVVLVKLLGSRAIKAPHDTPRKLYMTKQITLSYYGVDGLFFAAVAVEPVPAWECGTCTVLLEHDQREN